MAKYGPLNDQSEIRILPLALHRSKSTELCGFRNDQNQKSAAHSLLEEIEADLALKSDNVGVVGG